jgi:hypothetical protein
MYLDFSKFASDTETKILRRFIRLLGTKSVNLAFEVVVWALLDNSLILESLNNYYRRFVAVKTITSTYTSFIYRTIMWPPLPHR